MSCFGTQIKHWFAVFHSCLLLVWTLEVGLDIGQGQSTWTSALVVKDVAHEKRSSSYVLKNTQKKYHVKRCKKKRNISQKVHWPPLYCQYHTILLPTGDCVVRTKTLFSILRACSKWWGEGSDAKKVASTDLMENRGNLHQAQCPELM